MSPQTSKPVPQTSNSPKRTTPQKTPQKGTISSPLNGNGHGHGHRHGRQQTPRNGSTSTVSTLPGVVWSQQGAVTRQSASLLSDSPASLSRKFTGQVDCPTLRVDGGWSWGGVLCECEWELERVARDDMTLDMVTDKARLTRKDRPRRSCRPYKPKSNSWTDSFKCGYTGQDVKLAD